MSDASVLVVEPDRCDFFETLVEGREAKQAANWILGDLLGKLNKTSLELSEAKLTAKQLGELLDLVNDGEISGRMAKQVFEEMFETGKAAKVIVEERGLVQVSDTKEIETYVERVLSDHGDKVTEYQNGKDKLLGFFVGQIMKETGGKANPKVVNDILLKRLGR